MIDRIVFLEFKEEAEAFARLWQQEKFSQETTRVIPLSLQVQLVLKREGIPFESTLPYFGRLDHEECMKISEEWLVLLESYQRLGPVLMGEVVFSIRLVINYILWVTGVVVNAVNAFQPKELWGPEGRFPDKDLNWKINPNDRFLGFLVRDCALAFEKTYRCIDGNTPGKPQTRKEIFPEPVEDIYYYGVVKPSPSARFLTRILVGMIKRRAGKKKIAAVAADGYGMRGAVEQMGDDFYCLALDTGPVSVTTRNIAGIIRRLLKNQPVAVPAAAFPFSSEQVLELIEIMNTIIDELLTRIDDEWKDRFKYKKIDLKEYIAGYIHTGTRFHLARVIRTNAGVETLLEKMRPAVLLSPFSSGVFGSLGETCKSLGIPTLMISHGSHLPPRNELEEIEQRRLTHYIMLSPHYQFTAAQSPWAARHAEYYKKQEKTINTGPVLWARTRQEWGQELRKKLQIPANDKVVVYAVAQRKRSSIRFHVYETEDEYLKHMADLAEAVDKIENLHLILKLHPAAEFSDEDMRSVLPKCDRLHVLHREPFDRVLSSADVLVSYCSTTIEEAVFNRIPVIQYDRWNRYCHLDALNCDEGEPNDWSPDAVYYLTDPGRLETLLRHALNRSKEVAGNDGCYKKHLFSPSDSKLLKDHIPTLIPNQNNK